MKEYMNRGIQKEKLDDFAMIFGGLEDMKDKYPALYKAFQNTLSAKQDISVVEHTDELMGSSIPEDFDIKISHISYTDETRHYVRVDVEAFATCEDGFFILFVFSPQLSDREKDGCIVAEDVGMQFIGNHEEVSLVFPAEFFSDEWKNNNETVEVVAGLYIVNDKVTYYKGRETLDSYGLNYTGTFKIFHPVIKHTDSQNKDINIAYRGESGFNKDKLDYYYTDMSDGCLRIPSEGKIVVDGASLDDVSAKLKAENDSGNYCYHKKAGAELTDSQTIVWHIPENFEQRYNDILKSPYSYVTYTLEITAENKQLGRKYLFTVTNKENGPTLNKHIINKIFIYKDCFATGTKLMLEDGSEKKIEDIRMGDLLLTPDGSSKVKDIQSIGTKTALARIRGENRREALMSIHHPVETADGLVCASFLPEGIEIMTWNGSTTLSELYITPEVETKLYQLILESGSRLYAGGFLVGDCNAKLSEAERANNIRYQVDEKWRRDYDSWTERIGLPVQNLQKRI